jgi:ADP-heptose:LPS heptosyltransferase
MKRAGSWDLIDYQHRDAGYEYSHLFVFKKVGSGQHFSWQRPKPQVKRAGVVRYGAWGDLLQASSVIKGLKDQGYHVTLHCSPPGADIITHDPNIDVIQLQDKDQVPNQNLGEFWAHIAKKYDKFVNLSESIENTLLSTPGRIQHTWSPALRHRWMNQNYMTLQHAIADVPDVPQVRFFATSEEHKWARKEKAKLGAFVIAWSLAGSSVHKTWPYLDSVIAALMIDFPDVQVVLLGNTAGKILEQGWENEKRVHRRAGEWHIRESLAFVEECDLIIGPETGVMNSVSMRPMPKVVFLSHSTDENLTRDWVNTHVLASETTVCPGRGNNEAPACHQLHYGWEFCKRTEAGVAQCQADISFEQAYKVIWHAVQWAKEKAA